jgi:hypothetical protein
MNVISSNEAILLSGENMKSVIASVVDRLAKMIIMVETGLRYFVDGALVANPEPMFVKSMGYCTVNVYVQRAEMMILVPSGVDFNTCVAILISQVNDRLHDLEINIPDGNVMFKNDNVFSNIREEYTRTVDSLIMPKGSKNQVMKRVFQVGSISGNRIPDNAFRWDINSSLASIAPYKADAIWLADKVDIYVNLMNAPLDRFSSHSQLDDMKNVLRHLGPKKVIEYFRTTAKQFSATKSNGGASKLHRMMYYSSESSEDIIIVGVDNANSINGAFMRLSRHDDDDEKKTNAVVTPAEFYSAFMDRKYNPSAKNYTCQLCLKDNHGTMYALCRTAAGLVQTETNVFKNAYNCEYLAICPHCISSDQVFADASRLTMIISYYVSIPFSEVCETHGIPKNHALLYEGLNSQLSKYYLRNDTTFALASRTVSLRSIIAFMKFLDEVPNGEVITFFD